MEKLVKINSNMGELEYEMYQDIPNIEVGTKNPIYGKSYLFFKDYLEKYIREETIPNPSLYDATTNRYIYYVEDYPVGEIGIRTNLNDYWKNRGSQIFYKIRISERKKGYGKKMLKLALEECRILGFDEVRINCNDVNYASLKIIINNGGEIDIKNKNYKTHEGTSSSYIIKLK